MSFLVIGLLIRSQDGVRDKPQINDDTRQQTLSIASLGAEGQGSTRKSRETVGEARCLPLTSVACSRLRMPH